MIAKLSIIKHSLLLLVAIFEINSIKFPFDTLFPVFNKYTGARGKSGSNDANAEYMGFLRGLLEKEDISYQTAELGKVDEGGGGTIAYILANLGMEVIDFGVAVLNMHAPWEITNKADSYEAYLAYRAFLR